MSSLHQAIYTSAEKGLQPGSSGYCIVASTHQIPESLLQSMEALSTYKHKFRPGETKNRPRFQVVRIDAAGTSWMVASRIGDAGFDYSHRNNFIAHHVAWQANAISGIPAHELWFLLRNLTSDWDGSPRFLDPPVFPRQPSPNSLTADTWSKWAGDAGWAGVVADVIEQGSACRLQFAPGAPIDQLIEEVLRLLKPTTVSRTTFMTGVTDLPVRTVCQLRVVDSLQGYKPLPGENVWSFKPAGDSCESTSHRVVTARLGIVLATKRAPKSTQKLETGVASRSATGRQMDVAAGSGPPGEMPFAGPAPPSLRRLGSGPASRDRSSVSAAVIAAAMLLMFSLGIGGTLLVQKWPEISKAVLQKPSGLEPDSVESPGETADSSADMSRSNADDDTEKSDTGHVGDADETPSGVRSPGDEGRDVGNHDDANDQKPTEREDGDTDVGGKNMDTDQQPEDPSPKGNSIAQSHCTLLTIKEYTNGLSKSKIADALLLNGDDLKRNQWEFQQENQITKENKTFVKIDPNAPTVTYMSEREFELALLHRDKCVTIIHKVPIELSIALIKEGRPIEISNLSQRLLNMLKQLTNADAESLQFPPDEFKTFENSGRQGEKSPWTISLSLKVTTSAQNRPDVNCRITIKTREDKQRRAMFRRGAPEQLTSFVSVRVGNESSWHVMPTDKDRVTKDTNEYEREWNQFVDDYLRQSEALLQVVAIKDKLVMDEFQAQLWSVIEQAAQSWDVRIWERVKVGFESEKPAVHEALIPRLVIKIKSPT